MLGHLILVLNYVVKNSKDILIPFQDVRYQKCVLIKHCLWFCCEVVVTDKLLLKNCFWWEIVDGILATCAVINSIILMIMLLTRENHKDNDKPFLILMIHILMSFSFYNHHAQEVVLLHHLVLHHLDQVIITVVHLVMVAVDQFWHHLVMLVQD